MGTERPVVGLLCSPAGPRALGPTCLLRNHLLFTGTHSQAAGSARRGRGRSLVCSENQEILVGDVDSDDTLNKVTTLS